jgi:hypothetical protein
LVIRAAGELCAEVGGGRGLRDIRSRVRPAGIIVRASTLLSTFFGQIDLIDDGFLRLH